MMALLRRGHQLMLGVMRQSGMRCFRSSSVLLKGSSSSTQSEFTGLENCFIWDDKHGFGFNKDGEVVIVRPGTLPTNGPVFSSEDLLNNPAADLTEQDPEPEDGQAYSS